MESLIYLAVWAGLVFLTMRVGGGAHVMGYEHGHDHPRGAAGAPENQKLRWIPPAKDTDPVCGKSVTTAKAKSSVHDGEVYYFCSRDCREIFEAAPGVNLGGGTIDQREEEHSHA
jgi:YHS domain-containing protein